MVGGGGQDQLSLSGTAGNDQVAIDARGASGSLGDMRFQVSGASLVQASGGGGADRLEIADTHGRDQLRVDGGGLNWQSGDATGRVVEAAGFEQVNVSGGRGDRMQIEGQGHPLHVSLDANEQNVEIDGMHLQASGYTSVTANGGGMGSEVIVNGTEGNDRLYWIGDQTIMLGSGLNFRLSGFEKVQIDGGDGQDTAIVYGSAEAERFAAERSGKATWSGQAFTGELSGFERVIVNGRGGDDRVEMRGFEATDQLTGRGNSVRAELGGISYYLRDIDSLLASTNPGHSSTADLDAVDYLFDLEGDW